MQSSRTLVICIGFPQQHCPGSQDYEECYPLDSDVRYQHQFQYLTKCFFNLLKPTCYVMHQQV
jgi:hypothetical protein